jgi:hypothetical protein
MPNANCEAFIAPGTQQIVPTTAVQIEELRREEPIVAMAILSRAFCTHAARG